MAEKSQGDSKQPKWKLSLRTLALSQPRRCRTTKKYDPKDFEPPEHVVSKGALKAKSTPRLIALAEPMRPIKKVDYESLQNVPPPQYVKKAALKAKCTPRSEMLARNTLYKMYSAVEMFRDHGDPFLSNMQKYIDLAKASMYREMYWPKAPPPPEPPPKLKSCMYKLRGCPEPKSRSEQYSELQDWCAQNSIPKPVLEPEPPPPSKKKAINELKKRLSTLAQPKMITEKFDEEEARKFTSGVSPEATKATASARSQELAKPKKITNPEPAPEGVAPGALTATASPRTEELAKPRERSGGPNEEKENPYGVKPEALTAFCSARTKKLAKPKERK